MRAICSTSFGLQHAVMYFYYWLAAADLLPDWFPAQLITLGQIAQMVVGVFVCGCTCYYYALSDLGCLSERNNLIAAALMYLSYLYLFVAFAIDKYFRKPSKPESKSI